jgi:hypothetical protein
LTAATVAQVALADPYEAFIDVETEQDLYDALSVRQISSDTFERLLDLLARGVDLDLATREELYELPNLTYAEVDAILAHRSAHPGRRLGDGRALVAAGVLEEPRYHAIAPFLAARASQPGWSGVAAELHVVARASLEEDGPPPLGLRLRAAGLGGYTAGVAVALTRQRLGEVRYDPDRRSLRAAAPSPGLAVPKAYLRWERESAAVLLGSYRAGFGQRLVFDNTGAEQPAGFAIDDQLVAGGGVTRACKLARGELPEAREEAAEEAAPCAGEETTRVAPDVRWREGLLGAALAARRLAAGAGWLALHAWASYAERSVYQYELVDRARCADPRRDLDPACAAPRVILASEAAPLEAAAAHAYQTLPAMFVEALAGGNATYWLDRRSRLGATAYAARTEDLLGGVALGTQEGARWPGGQRFGAVGAEAALGGGGVDVAAELARSFDELPPQAGVTRGGGLGAVLRLALSRHREEPLTPGPAAVPGAGAGAGTLVATGSSLEVTARYYQATFVNPYARPVAAPDELEGQRARDEAGLRVRASATWPRLAVRAAADGWLAPSTGTPRLSSELRVEQQPRPWLRWGAALAYDDKDLAHAGRDECYEGSRVTSAPPGGGAAGEAQDGDEPMPSPTSGEGASSCRGMKLSSRGRLTAGLVGLELTAQAQHELLDDGGGAAAAGPDDGPGAGSGGGGAAGPRRARQHRLTLWLVGRWRSPTGARVRVQLRHRDEAVGQGGARLYTGALDLRWPLGAAGQLSLRLDGQLAAASFLTFSAAYDVAL